MTFYKALPHIVKQYATKYKYKQLLAVARCSTMLIISKNKIITSTEYMHNSNIFAKYLCCNLLCMLQYCSLNTAPYMRLRYFHSVCHQLGKLKDFNFVVVVTMKVHLEILSYRAFQSYRRLNVNI